MRFRPILLALSSLMFAACLGDATTNATYPLVPIESTTFATSLGVNLAGSTKTASGLYYRDIRVGTGATLVAGSAVNAKYTGALANGSVFDAGTYPFTLGAGQVIRGWDEGIVGMKVGGSRQLIIPSSLGYGPTGSGPIPPNAVLVFTVEPQ
ncbi:MAG: peptidylprolyl isomerase FKBP-type [Gemmatimonadetes bacterium]|jgi:FKBP-type peptidyl-prolyl cis-trans isomerase FkpA|nr:peptidylprolyl isomerase FKBP-type [Gemmatimonadota bacterium]